MLRRSARVLSRTTNPSQFAALPKPFSTAALLVRHDKTKKHFYVKLDESAKEIAVIQYEVVDGKTLDLYHTEVPAAFGGLGVGKILAKGAFDHCVQHKLQMKLTCDFLQKCYLDNPLPEYKQHVVS